MWRLILIWTKRGIGRFGFTSNSASEVVGAAMREFEDKSRSLEALRSHLEQGAKQATARIFVDKWSPADIVARAKGRRDWAQPNTAGPAGS